MAKPRTAPLYRRVETLVWEDDAFRSLSRPKPNAQTLWLYLLTGPRTTMIPGVVRARPAVMADDLRWPLRGWQSVMDEIVAAGLAKFDPDVGLVVLTNALMRRGIPREGVSSNGENGKISWRRALAEIPRCDLRDELTATVESFIYATDGEKPSNDAETRGMVCADHPPDHRERVPATIGAQDTGSRIQEAGAGDCEAADAAPAPAAKRPARVVKPKPAAMPDDFAPGDAHRAFAAENQIDLDREMARFADHHRAKGSTFASWPHALANWLRNAVEFRARDQRGPPRSPPPGRAPPAAHHGIGPIDTSQIRPPRNP